MAYGYFLAKSQFVFEAVKVWWRRERFPTLYIESLKSIPCSCYHHLPNAPPPSAPAPTPSWLATPLFTSGQIGLIPETGVLAGDTIEAQATQVFLLT